MPDKAVRCRADGIRVWRGFRAVSYLHDRTGFDDAIRLIFAPQTAQQMMPLGLQAYFPTLLPATSIGTQSIQPGSNPGSNPSGNPEQQLPDEIALVVYPSAEVYKAATRDNVAGRAYGLLHVSAFNFSDESLPASKTGTPIPWDKNWQPDTPYIILDKEVDWHTGNTEVLALQIPPDIPFTEIHAQIAACIERWVESSPRGVNGGIFCATEHYLLYWENRDVDAAACSLGPILQDLLGKVYVKSVARVHTVPPAFTRNDDGVDMAIGELLDLRL